MNLFLIIILLAIIICIVLYSVTFKIIFKNKRILKEYKAVTGRIINIEKIRGWGYDGARNDTGALEGRITTVEYNVNNKSYTFKPNTFKAGDKVGDEYIVLYNINDPSIVRGYRGTRFAPVILLCVSAGFTIIFIITCVIFVFMGLI